MTAEEMRRAVAAYAAYYERMKGQVPDAEDTFLAGWQEAARQERERLAKLVEGLAIDFAGSARSWEDGCAAARGQIAAAIRGRGC